MTTLEELQQEIAKAKEEILNLAKEKDEQIQQLTAQLQTVHEELNQTKADLQTVHEELNQTKADLQTKINTAQKTADDGINKANAAQTFADNGVSRVKKLEQILDNNVVKWWVHPNGNLELKCKGEDRFIVIGQDGVYLTWSAKADMPLFRAAKE